jgi:outer membrane protein assembly factor BamB
MRSTLVYNGTGELAMTIHKNLLLACAFLTGSALAAGDWPQFRGPNRDGTCEKGWFTSLPAAPKPLWTSQVGGGCASLICSGDKVYAFGNSGSIELDAENKSQDAVTCFEAETGKVIWKHNYDAPFLPLSDAGGPNATPICDGASVYTESKLGIVHCYEAATGKLQWERKLVEELKLDDKTIKNKYLWGGISSSPLLAGNALIVCRGGDLLGLDKTTGKTLYEVKIDKGSITRSSSPTSITTDGKCEVVIGFNRYPSQGLLFFDPSNGKASHELVPCLVGSGDPIFFEHSLFISDRPQKSGEGGSRLFSVAASGDKPSLQWQVKEEGSYWGNAVRAGDYIFSGEMSNFACLEIKTGQVKWREKSLTNSQPVVCGDKLIVMNYSKIVILDAGPEYKVVTTAEVLPNKSAPKVARFSLSPALAPGRIYCKQSNGDVACLDVSGK